MLIWSTTNTFFGQWDTRVQRWERNTNLWKMQNPLQSTLAGNPFGIAWLQEKEIGKLIKVNSDQSTYSLNLQLPARKSTSGARDFLSNHKVYLWVLSSNNFLKNAEPIAVNFGRKPVWNCLTARKGNRKSLNMTINLKDSMLLLNRIYLHLHFCNSETRTLIEYQSS